MAPTTATTPDPQPAPLSHPSPTGATAAPGPLPELAPDILGEPWVARTIPVTESPAAPGADHAVLVHQRGAVPAPGPNGELGAPRHGRAVLYLHGRNDYFFQTWLAEAFLAAGYEFYALELRTCGRAGVGYWSPHDVRDLRVHDEEIGEALRIIRSEHGHSTVVLNGHSTGGLQAVIWAGDHPGSVEAVTLNSPWLQLNSSGLVRSYGSALIDLISRRDPDRIIDNPGEIRELEQAEAASTAKSAAGAAPDAPLTADAATAVPVDSDPGPIEVDIYSRTLHRRWGGEWDWDLSLKPSPSFPVRAGFLAGIRRLQREVHHGLGIGVPVLVCCSTASGGPGISREEALRCDTVLSVEQIVERSRFLGEDVTVVQIPGGVHDLVLSPSPVREEYLSTLTGWLNERLS
ncbi:Lysophospholipase, alpha-beta hydrolase superfamily [Actinomyces ruminicola]|uniref:Lysophospholipase, alpha-beta hydrolase superfamily n=1 Tax=Actinomyces ruminicola TaxID=332524 RepID=A0A1H0ED82_9ACTO|nr:alpha/beta fold hydrolase [Actinomyces ruminicola]SDN80437.1 Lysophospholipase, alpha-beta hydrolase superfamily [Actinomyces ruminicola]